MYENIEDALRDAVRALGGTKAVGGKLFPSLPIEQAASRVADCLNVDRRQHFAPSEVCWLLRQARIAGHHETMVYIATVAGYEPPRPASDPEELAALQQAFIRATSDLKAIGHRIETISARAAIRPAA
ncbi:MAG TPA: hypothetical protein PK752_05970 [Accumulibacter sp.]|uniref:hypothetical protein n=1 Tax=Accumulibacter sp. TaxID=2053492 RepID=UPI002C46FE63|nr:hypothetical protein [Accumulibacter sp.]HRD87796.1 hypothetical protein [Accumulibacter sp.]